MSKEPVLPCGHSRSRAYRIRRGLRLVSVCRTCRRWFSERRPRTGKTAADALTGFRPASEVNL